MNKLSSYQRYLQMIAISGAFALAGCASVPAPTEQMAVSRSAIANALSAGGSEYAPVEMRSAQDKLDLASRAIEKDDFENARRLAEASQVDARLAEKKAQAGKAMKAASVTREDNRVLREEMNRKTQ
jgi:Domain of unknown function (DUF4398)